MAVSEPGSLHVVEENQTPLAVLLKLAYAARSSASLTREVDRPPARTGRTVPVPQPEAEPRILVSNGP